MAVYNLLVDLYGSLLVMIMLLFCFAKELVLCIIR